MKKTIRLVFTGAITGALITLGACSDDDKTLPKIDGFNNSDEVAADNLVAHWTFDDTKAEDISGAVPSNEYGAATTFVAGQLGKAIKLNKSAFKYPTIANLNTANALNTFTVSMWVNAAGQKGVAGGGYQSFFSLVPGNVADIWPDLHLGLESGRNRPSSDTLQLKGLFLSHLDGGAVSRQDNVAQVNDGKGGWFMGANEWSLFTFRWNPSTKKLDVFGNGVAYGAWTDRDVAANLNLVMAVPVTALFGSLPSTDTGYAGAGAQQGWNPFASATIDDVRVFNTALTDAEIKALYNLGVAGR